MWTAQSSIDFLKGCVEKIEKAKLAYAKAREDEFAKKQLYDNADLLVIKQKSECKSEAEFTNKRKIQTLREKIDYDNAQEETKRVVKQYDMLRELIQLHKFLVNQEGEQVKLQKYEA